MGVLSAFLFRTLIASDLGDVDEVLVVHRAKNGLEEFEVVAGDAVSTRVRVYREERDRRFAAECAVLAVVAKCVPRSPKRFGPLGDFGIVRLICWCGEMRGVRFFFGNFREPVIRALQR